MDKLKYEKILEENIELMEKYENRVVPTVKKIKIRTNIMKGLVLLMLLELGMVIFFGRDIMNGRKVLILNAATALILIEIVLTIWVFSKILKHKEMFLRIREEFMLKIDEEFIKEFNHRNYRE